MWSAKQIRESLASSQSGGIELSPKHTLWSPTSLRWDWQAGEVLTIDYPFELSWRFRDDGVVYAPAFALSIYCEAPTEGELRVEIGDAWFTFRLDFTGWRAAIVRYHGDMQGTPQEAAQGFRVVAPNAGNGTLWLDGVMPDGCIYEAIPMPDLQVPYVADGADEHRGPGSFRSHLRAIDLAPASADGVDPAASAVVMERLSQSLLATEQIDPLAALDALDAFMPGSRGPVIRIGTQMAFTQSPPPVVSPKVAGTLMLDLARGWLLADNRACRDGYLLVLRHLMDQGWVRGSSLGTLHLLGYALAPLCQANFLMRHVLAEEGLVETVGQTMQWLSNARECAILPPYECQLDWLHTFMQNQLLALLMEPDEDLRGRWLLAFSRYVDACLRMQTDDAIDGFKWDGAAFHHYGHYPDYAAGAVVHVGHMMRLLTGTPFAFSDEALANVRRSVETLLVSAMGNDLPIAVSGRHPFLQERWVSQIRQAAAMLGCKPTPESCFVPVNTSALATHRRPGWLACIRGFSKYAWSTEVFPGSSNRYGAFQGHGSVEILLPGGQAPSGFVREGWDWRHVPGATTVRVPLASMLDKGSCLRSRETFAGALSLDGQSGHFAVNMNSDFFQLTARKSVFCFDDEIVCLGSDISCWRQNVPTITTLFQNAIKAEAPTVEACDGRLRDAVGNTYLIEGTASLRLQQGLQYSLDQCTTEPTSGRFLTAWFDHGRRPHAASYAYRILVQHDGDPRTTILRHGRLAHIVHHPPTGITAFALFEAGAVDHELLTSASKPCLVQLQRQGDQVAIAMLDPDLQWGHDRCNLVTVTLTGAWQPASDTSATCRILDGHTQIAFTGNHGRPCHLKLSTFPL